MGRRSWCRYRDQRAYPPDVSPRQMPRRSQVFADGGCVHHKKPSFTARKDSAWSQGMVALGRTRPGAQLAMPDQLGTTRCRAKLELQLLHSSAAHAVARDVATTTVVRRGSRKCDAVKIMRTDAT